MKRWISLFLLFTMLLTLGGCVKGEVLTEPPRMSVFLGDQQISGRQSSYGWDYTTSKGNFSVMADGVHPLDSNAETYTTTESTATLRFGAEPKSISVECWSADLKASDDPPSIPCHLEGHQLTLQNGSYVYSVRASWTEECYSGSCSYTFKVNCIP